VANATGTGAETLKAVGLKKRFGGTQMALVSLPLDASRKIVDAGRLRVGLVSCRVRLAEAKTRCFRCLAFGHTAKLCDGPDRTSCCRRCGEAGHLVAGCCATAAAVQEFAKLVGAVGDKSL